MKIVPLDGTSPRILLIDDVPEDRSVAQAVMLRAWPSVEVVEIDGALDFAEHFASNEFEVVIVGHPLSWASSIDLVRAIRARSPECIIVTLVAPTKAAGLAEPRPASDAHVTKTTAGLVSLPQVIEQRLGGHRSRGGGIRTDRLWEHPLWEQMPAPMLAFSTHGDIVAATPALLAALEPAGASYTTDSGGAEPEWVAGRAQRPGPRSIVSAPRPIQPSNPLERLFDWFHEPDDASNLLHQLELRGHLEHQPIEVRGLPPGAATLSAWPADANEGQGAIERAQLPAVDIPPRAPIYVGLVHLDRVAGQAGVPGPSLTSAPSTAVAASAMGGPGGPSIVEPAFELELLEPLALFAEYTETLKQSSGEQANDTTRVVIERMEDLSRRLQSMLRGMSRYRAEHPGQLSNGEERVALGSAVAEALERLDSAIASSGAKVMTDHLPTIDGSYPMLVTLFELLLDNAIKFRGPEAPRIRITAEERTDDWVIAVHDNGIGVPETEVERIFGMFERLHETDEYVGAGLGLSLCRYIAATHGGDIWLKAGKPGGSVVSVTFSKHARVGRDPDSPDPASPNDRPVDNAEAADADPRICAGGGPPR